jgi:hypothetical protein
MALYITARTFSLASCLRIILSFRCRTLSIFARVRKKRSRFFAHHFTPIMCFMTI